MNQRSFVPFSYVLAVAAICFAVYNKVIDAGSIALIRSFLIVVVTQLVFSFAAVFELRYSLNINRNAKYSWAFLLFIAPVPVGIFYLLTVRKKMLNSPSAL